MKTFSDPSNYVKYQTKLACYDTKFGPQIKTFIFSSYLMKLFKQIHVC